MTLADMRVAPLPGDGIVARWSGYVVVAAGGNREVRAELVRLVRTAAGEAADAATLAHRLAALITATEPARLPAFGALADSGDAVAVLLRGAVELRAEGEGGVTELSGADRPTWVDDYLRGTFGRITIGVGDVARSEPGDWDLEAGVVPGSGAVLLGRDALWESAADAGAADETELVGEVEATEPPDAEPPDAEPPDAEPPDVEPEPEERPADEAEPDAEEDEASAEPVAEAAFVTIDFGSSEDVVERAPLPVAQDATQDRVPVGTAPKPDDAPAGVLVRGLRCIRGHFNHPRARFCALCGISMVQQTQVLVEGERPPLGILVFGDGKTVGLATSYLLGRDPAIDQAVGAGELLPLQLDDPDQILSRVHCEVRLTDWDVQLVDRNSANGTYVRLEGAEEWARLTAGTPTTLEPGMEARVGSHRFVYESHHQQS